MIKKNKVSLWLGIFDNEDSFKKYIEVDYDEDGNYIPSKFQADFGIKKYDMDAIESDWISDQCNNLEMLLEGFSNDYEIIPQYKKIMKNMDVSKYNSIILLYNFEYENNAVCNIMEYIGCVDVTFD